MGETKTRSDAWEACLSEEEQRQLYALTKPPSKEEAEEGRAWLRDYYRDVLPYLSLQGIVAPSQSSWYRFLGRMREREAAKAIISVETSKRIAQGIVAADVDAHLAADMMTALSVDAAAKGNDEAARILADSAAKYHAAAIAAAKLKIDAARQRTAEDQLRLAREKFEAAEKRLAAVQKTCEDNLLTTEDKLARIKEIFG